MSITEGASSSALGWVWEHYGEYTRDKSLVYEKNFLNYVILKAFGIELKRD